jgi:hypothetical protein
MSETNMVRSIRISDPHWYQLEVEAKRLGYRTRHKFIAAQLMRLVSAQTTPKTDNATETA